jgi:hypothetical protein
VRKNTDEKYSDTETLKRFEAALRGARIAGHKPMKNAGHKKIEKISETPKGRRKRT